MRNLTCIVLGLGLLYAGNVVLATESGGTGKEKGSDTAAAERPPSRTEGEAAATETVRKEAPKKKWFELFTLSGDLRYRHETIQQEGKTERNRHRLRARLGVKVKISDCLSAAFRLASGSADPVSTNQTLSDAYATKDIRLDLAYFQLEPEPLEGLKALGGKMKNPFAGPEKSELIWDGDLNPEGLAAAYTLSLMKELEISADAGGFWIQERKSNRDTWMAALRVTVEIKPSETLGVEFGGGVFHYENMKGLSPLVDDDDGFGNTLSAIPDGSGGTIALYANNYLLLEGFARIGGKLGPVKFSVFFDVVVNQKAEEENTGWLAGVKLSLPYKISLGANYRVVEADAVVGAFTDSDFIGGGTDGRGVELSAGVEPVEHLKLGVAFFANETPEQDGSWYQRLQVDIQIKF